MREFAHSDVTRRRKRTNNDWGSNDASSSASASSSDDMSSREFASKRMKDETHDVAFVASSLDDVRGRTNWDGQGIGNARARATGDDASGGADASGKDESGGDSDALEEEEMLPSTFQRRYVRRRMVGDFVGEDEREGSRKIRDERERRARTTETTDASNVCVLRDARLVAGARERAKIAREEREREKARKGEEEKEARERNRDDGEAFAGVQRRGLGTHAKAHERDVGSFEKHTKGIGMKLLEKMGYKKGEGLGKGASGITRALETTVRPKNMGMGFNNFKENVNDPTKARGREESDEDAMEEGMKEDDGSKERDAAKRAQEQTMWKKRNDLRREKREYKTAEELLAEEQDKARDSKSVKATAEKLNIIDMRGAHAQIINASELHKSRVISADDDDLMLPELQHNLKLIVDLAESDISKLDVKIRSEKDTLEILRREKARLSKQATTHAEFALRTKSALKLVERCDVLSKTMKTSTEFSELTQAWTDVVKKHPEEFFAHRLGRLALAHAAPYVRSLFKDWDPSADPARGIDQIKPWRELLSPERVPDAYKNVFEDDLFDALLREPLLGRLRPIITSQWDPTKPSDILNFIEAWSRVMPEALLHELTHALILPRLQRRVGEWQPTKERVALHTWFHPWLALLHNNLKDLYPSIRQKFTVALAEWDASDPSALALLKPWARVFEPKDWSSLMRRCITPKLEDALAMMQINPSNQVLDPLKCVLKWEPVLGSSAFITILEQHFFHKWHAALHAWLNAGSVDFDQVTQWYLGWKTVFSEELLAHERVRVQLNVALDMMNQAATGDGVVMPNVAAAQPNADRVVERKANPMDEPQFTLKEMIEQFANSHDVEFVPNPSGRRHDGLAVYTFGGVNVIVDAAREAIRAYIDGEWIPISLDQLVQRARAHTK